MLHPNLIHHVLDWASEEYPESIAVSDGTVRWTYSELAEWSKNFASWLQHLGVLPGDRVACHFQDQAMTIAALYGTSRALASFIPINPAVKPFVLKDLLGDAEVRVVVVDDESSVGRISSMASATTASLVELLDYVAHSFTEPSELLVARTEVPAMLIYTSGSTSRPKAVVCPHDTVLFVTASISAALQYQSTDVVYVRLPFSFDYGLYQALLTARCGAELAIATDRNSTAVLREIRDRNATVVPVVPSLAKTITTLAQRASASTKVRMFTNTGEALSNSTIAALRACFPGVCVVLMFGTTECKRIAIAEPDLDLRRPGSVGRPIPGTQVLIVDDEGNCLGPGQVGQIVAQGPHVMAGYWNDSSLSCAVFKDDADGVRSVCTGDYGYLDDDGFLYFQHRRGDRFKRRGVRTSAAEVERAAVDIPGVIDAFAVLSPGDEFVIFVVGNVTESQVIRGLAERVEDAKVPDRCVRLEAFPLTLNGKIDGAAIGRLFDSVNA